jgi:hypothetical protein
MNIKIQSLPRAMIIAQPKASSTSLMSTLGRMTSLSFGQQMLPLMSSAELKLHRLLDLLIRKSCGWSLNPTASHARSFREKYPALEYPALSLAHSDMCDFGMASKNDIISLSYDLHKQHFPPTETNTKIFSHIPLIFITRDIEETISSYQRVPGYSRFKELCNNGAFRVQLHSDLRKFQNGWLRESEKREILLVKQSDLIAYPSETLKRCITYLGFDHTDITDWSLNIDRVHKHEIKNI